MSTVAASARTLEGRPVTPCSRAWSRRRVATAIAATGADTITSWRGVPVRAPSGEVGGQG